MTALDNVVFNHMKPDNTMKLRLCPLPTLIGLAVHTNHVQAMTLRSQGTQIWVTGFAQVAIEATANDTQHKALIFALKTLREQLPTRSRRIAIAIPDQTTVKHTFTAPITLNDAELTALARYKAAEYLKCAIDALYLDYEPLPSAATHSKHYQLTAVRKQHVEDLLAPLIGAKLKPTVVDLHSACLARAAQFNQTNKGILSSNQHVHFCTASDATYWQACQLVFGLALRGLRAWH